MINVIRDDTDSSGGSKMPYWRLYYHFAWATKERLPLIDSQFSPDLYHVIADKVCMLEGICYAVGGIEDHIHLVVSVPPKMALATFIGEVKGNASHFINHVIEPSFRFQWQAEYGVVSFAERHLPRIVEYVQNQRQRHKEGKTIDALEFVDPEEAAHS